jgi:hypothetical protein
MLIISDRNERAARSNNENPEPISVQGKEE